MKMDSLICDAGCGHSGHIDRYPFDKGIPLLGVDISERCVELARECNPYDFEINSERIFAIGRKE